MSSNRMHEETFAVLRHLEVHGPRTKVEITKGTQQPERELTKRLANLMMLGYLVLDGTTKPAQFTLTGKARHKLAAPDAVYPRRPKSAPKKAIEAEANAMSATQASRPHKRAAINGDAAYMPVHRRALGTLKPRYHAIEYRPSVRPGANDALALPSRHGDRLHWRDGRITDLDGNTPA